MKKLVGIAHLVELKLLLNYQRTTKLTIKIFPI